MCSKIEQINVNDMFNRAMSIRENTVITYTDLMTDKEIKIWNELNAAERVGIILPFNLMLVKKGTFERNPDTGRMNLVYNEHVETVDVPIKPSDRMKARDLLGRYHSLFTEKVDLNVATPVFVDNIGEDDERMSKI